MSETQSSLSSFAESQTMRDAQDGYQEQKIEQEVAQNNKPSEDGDWYWSEGQLGQGPRPDWLDPKYKNVEEQAKAYPNAQKLLGKMAPPKEYDYSVLKEFNMNPEVIMEDLNAFGDLSRELRLQQDQITPLLKLFGETMNKMLPPPMSSIVEEVGEETMTSLSYWLANNLSTEELDSINDGIVSADMVRALDKLRQKVTTPSRVLGKNAQGEIINEVQFDSQERLDSELRDPRNAQRYIQDEYYRETIDKRMARLANK